MNGNSWLEKLESSLGPNLLESPEFKLLLDEPMARHTTLRLGGSADLWVEPKSSDALEKLLSACLHHAIPVTPVGSGTNLLVRDGGIRGLTLNLKQLNRVELGATITTEQDKILYKVHVEAGCSTGRLLKAVTDWELGGLEFLGGVPGSVGGGLRMNAGTYLGEFTDVVHSVTSHRLRGGSITRSHAECGFRYRDSDLPADEVVSSSVLHMKKRPKADIESDVRGLKDRRKDREPTGNPNSGSTFKNPEGDHAGRLIESCGLKGRRLGGALVSPKHANWLLHDRACGEPCTASHLVELIELVRSTVEQQTGVRLNTEVKIIGEEPDTLNQTP